jgi:hypothetical protein
VRLDSELSCGAPVLGCLVGERGRNGRAGHGLWATGGASRYA